MSKLKKCFYLFSGILSALCLVCMLLLILAQISARALGVIIPSSEDFTGWLLSATFFFGLAYTFQNGGHIRVSILLNRLQKNRRFVEIHNLLIGSCISAFLALYTWATVYESFAFDEVTDTYVALPLWVIQLPMAIGSLSLFLAMLDNFIILCFTKNTPQYISYETEKTIER